MAWKPLCRNLRSTHYFTCLACSTTRVPTGHHRCGGGGGAPVFDRTWFSSLGFKFVGLFNNWYDACAGYLATVTRIEVMDFSLPFLKPPQSSFFVKNGEAFDTKDITGKRIGKVFCVITTSKWIRFHSSTAVITSVRQNGSPVSVKKYLAVGPFCLSSKMVGRQPNLENVIKMSQCVAKMRKRQVASMM